MCRDVDKPWSKETVLATGNITVVHVIVLPERSHIESFALDRIHSHYGYDLKQPLWLTTWAVSLLLFM